MARHSLSRGPTIVDVARAAGVSVSTVSRVMRDHADVGAETRAHVRQAIDLLGYRPSPIARALVSGQSRLLTLLVSDITNPFYPQLAKSVEQEAKQAGYAVVICNTADRTTETRRYVERLLSQGLDGVIHASVAHDEQVLLSLMADERRVVFTNRRPAQSAVSYVVSDNEGGATELTRHLLSLGHRRIGFITGPKYAAQRHGTSQGLPPGDARGGQHPAVRGRGRLLCRERTPGGPRVDEATANAPTAMIAVNDSVALGALGALADSRLKVPEDIALAGFDGTQLSASPLLSLTTVDQHIENLGRRSVQILLEADRRPERVSARSMRYFPPSCCCAAAPIGAATGPRLHEGTEAIRA